MDDDLDNDLFAVFNEKPQYSRAQKRHSAESVPNEKNIKLNDSIPSTNNLENVHDKEISKMSPIKEDTEDITNSVKTLDVECGLTCNHRVSMPSSFEYTPLVPSRDEPAKEYSFVLDEFQKQAILCVENNESVIVAAHTSSGKTVVAEYAIAKCLKNQKRVIYTSPIKALSNQKYRELSEEFRDVGLQTGDVTLNPSATCVVMTTEILRNMLYKGSEIMKEVAWVIFDEIHYMRDKERGVVWEETIILLPDTVRYVFLSATIPNAEEFAEWISLTHSQRCHVVSTDFRPTPLQHYIVPLDASALYLIMDESNNLKEENLSKAFSPLHNSKSEGSRGSNRPIVKVVKFMLERKFAPVIVFSFSKRECEYYASSISVMDFNDEREKRMIEEVFTNAISGLAPEDKNMPQITSCLPFLKRGIGIHHSGLLPILKEVTEILFSEGLIKFLFSTETFSMGLNMPARTVLFTSCRKFDGISNRTLQSSEYIQMSGRAGRRGIDDRGISILMLDNETTTGDIKSMYTGCADPLKSAFRLTYNMILNLIRIDGIDPEYMMRRSFFQYQTRSEVEKHSNKVKQLKEKYNQSDIKIENESEFASYVELRNEMNKIKVNCQRMIINYNVLARYLQNGRILKISGSDADFGYGICLKYHNENSSNGSLVHGYTGSHCDVFLPCRVNLDSKNNHVYLPNTSETSDMNIIPVSCKMISDVTGVVVNLPADSKNKKAYKSTLQKALVEISKKFPDGFPLIDPIKDMKIKDEKFIEQYKSLTRMEDRLKSLPITAKLGNESKKTQELLNIYEAKLKMLKEIQYAEEDLNEAKSVIQLSQLKARKRILRQLGFINATDGIEMKGRVACEISSADELVLTELLFKGFFNDLNPEDINAVLSCFLYQERGYADYDEIGEKNKKLYDILMKTAKEVAAVSKKCKLEFNEENYLTSFKIDLMSAFSAWTNGQSFESICGRNIFEGSIIRCLRRLDELLKQLVAAAKCIGNVDLETKFKLCVKKIKRNIAFSASLYL